MKRFAVAVASAALVILTPAAAGGVDAGPIHRVRAGVAINWAGYIAHTGPFTSASTSWTEPSVSCGSNETSALASFAGIDGSGSSTVEQIGTLSICQNGRVSHRAFFEMYPRGPQFPGKRVRAGDSLTASVVAGASRTFTLTLQNRTAGWTFKTTQRSRRARLASAEAIVEAPTVVGSGISSLANFGQINFNGTSANGKAISNFGPEAVTMATTGGTIKAEWPLRRLVLRFLAPLLGGQRALPVLPGTIGVTRGEHPYIPAVSRTECVSPGGVTSIAATGGHGVGLLPWYAPSTSADAVSSGRSSRIGGCTESELSPPKNPEGVRAASPSLCPEASKSATPG